MASSCSPVSKRAKMTPSDGQGCVAAAAPPALAAFVAWLAAKGATLDGVELRPYADGSGVSGFATRALAPGVRVVTIPQELILDAAAAWRSELGTKVS